VYPYGCESSILSEATISINFFLMLLRRTYKTALGLLAALILISIGLSIFTARVALYPWWYKSRYVGQELRPCSSYQERVYRYCKDPMRDFGLPFTAFSLPTVTGWYIPVALENSPARGIVILVHGGGADRRAMLRHAPYLHRAGYDVILIDCLNHGLTKGDGKGLSFGLNEAGSITAAAEWARTNLKNASGSTPLVAMGTSQGAVAALRAGAKSSLIRGVIAENPYSSVKRLFMEYPMLEWVPGGVKKLALVWVELWVGTSLDELEAPALAVGLQGKSVLVLHARHDRLIALDHATALVSELKQHAHVQFEVFEKGDHEYLWNESQAEYEKTILKFLAALER